MKMYYRNTLVGAAMIFAGFASGCSSYESSQASIDNLDTDSRQALTTLIESNSAASLVSQGSRSVLIFPNIVKAGLVIGGAYGEGEHRRGNTVLGRYNSVTGSWGLQAGAQSYSYALFLMNEAAETYLVESDGWEIGVGPTVVVVDSGAAVNLSSSTLTHDAYAFIFDQQGLMAGISIEGTKISRTD